MPDLSSSDVAAGRQKVRRVIIPAAILSLAALMRCVLPGAYPLLWDETRILYDAMMLARHGRWLWLTSNQAAWILPGHSPFTDYLLALPYLFTSDPVAIRLFVGGLGVAAVGIAYWMTKRYFGMTAAAITGGLLAVAVPAVEASRFVWNPNIAPLFIMLTLFTALLGYAEGKRWAQTVHWLCLALAIQAHPGNALLAPVSLLLFIYVSIQQRRLVKTPNTIKIVSVRATLIGWITAVASFVPYAIGIGAAGFKQGGTDTHPPLPLIETLRNALGNFADRVSTINYNVPLRASNPPGDWWPSLAVDKLLWLQVLVTALGIIWLLIRAYRHAGNDSDSSDNLNNLHSTLAGAFLALAALIPLLLSMIVPVQLVGFYLMSITFAAYPIQGIVFARIAHAGKLRAWLVSGVVTVLAVIQVWLFVGYMRWLMINGVQEAFRAPIYFHQAVLDQWEATGKPLVIIEDTLEGKYGPTEQERLWLVMTEGYRVNGDPVRLLRMPSGIPVAPGGELLIESTKGTTIPAYFGADQAAIQKVGQLADGTPSFQWLPVDSASLESPTMLPDGSALFSNGARLMGIQAKAPPTAGEPWPITLFWKSEVSRQRDQYQFSVRVVAASGKAYGQFDAASLAGPFWHADDTVINQLSIPINALLPNAPLYVQVLMYTYPQMRNANIIDAAGNTTGQIAVFRILGAYF